jgi:putative aldouronate transport system permease protein
VSVSENAAVFRNDVRLIPIGFTIDAYRTLIRAGRLPLGYGNSIYYTALGTAVNMVFTTSMAYALSKKRLPHRRLITAMVIVTFFFTGGLIPMFLVVRALGLYNTVGAIVLPTAIATWNLIILRTFFQTLPKELEESAQIDGANDITVMVRIAVPMAKAAIATIALFYAVQHWNSWFPALIYFRNADRYPLPVILRQIVIENRLDEELAKAGEFEILADRQEQSYMPANKIQNAVLFAAILPMMFLYPFLQRYFVKGVMIGSLKG